MKTQVLLSRIKWILLAGGPIFFCIRAIGLASSGGDCFGTINPLPSWVLLISEIMISGTAAIAGVIGLIQWFMFKKQDIEKSNKDLRKVIVFTGITAYLIHFIRVAFWISFCVI
jgi:hypothetical protein